MIIKDCKICGISDSNTLNFIINHPYPPKFVGFICNYKKSSRYVETNNLKKLLDVKKNKSKFVAVLVKPDNEILEKIKNLPFDYYQLYDCKPFEALTIKKLYKKKIIIALSIEKADDVKRFKLFENIADIYLFDSKGYEKSMSFNHSLLENIKFDKEVMLAGNIQINDDFKNLKKIANIIDISGGLETAGLKDISKIELFLNKIKILNNED